MTIYRISQLAERVGVRPTTLRFYERAGLLPAQRSESGYRLFDDTAVERLNFIAAGKRLGLPLEEIRELLGVWEDGLCTDVRHQLRPLLLASIAEAEQRAAELDVFIERLRQAVTEIDGPPRPGRCDPACGFLHPGPEPTPLSIQLTRSTSEPPPIACTLTGSDQAERLHDWRQLLAHATSRHAVDGGLRIGLPATAAAQVAELAAAEQQCCGFFDFTLRLADGELHLEVRAPTEAGHLLTEMFGTAG